MLNFIRILINRAIEEYEDAIWYSKQAISAKEHSLTDLADTYKSIAKDELKHGDKQTQAAKELFDVYKGKNEVNEESMEMFVEAHSECVEKSIKAQMWIDKA